MLRSPIRLTLYLEGKSEACWLLAGFAEEGGPGSFAMVESCSPAAVTCAAVGISPEGGFGCAEGDDGCWPDAAPGDWLGAATAVGEDWLFCACAGVDGAPETVASCART